jgi:hypothetical protein
MRGARWAGAAAATLAVSVAQAGCGGSDANHGEAAKPPQKIAADVYAASKQLHSFRLNGTITDAGGTTRVVGAIAGPERISFSEQRASDVVQVIALGSVTYIKASRAYYAAQPKLTRAQVTSYANRWLKLSTASNPSFAADLARETDLSIELGCWAARKRGLSVAGTASVGGRAAVIVVSDGTVPGSAPGKVYVAATGPAWPLRAVVTGPRKPGGSGACAEPTTSRTSDITVSDFNQPIALAAPASALDLTR